ncbi:hypothetical protein [Streptomyces sp. NPDC059166]|uniref:hypothetical protein n=1 Tax=Streptomyces sp. NPDC059166 TaxID=3346752 RepID=UPI0036B93B8E
MGLTYSYATYLRPRRVARLLGQLAGLAPPEYGAQPTEIILPGGERLVVPFRSQAAPGEPVDASDGSAFELDTSLMFEPDEALVEYARDYGPAAEPDGRVQIGYVYASVRFSSHLHPGYAEVDCWAATSGMSRLFARSPSIRRTFTGIAASSGGVCCLFDTGDGGPAQVCWMADEAIRGTVPDPWYPDRDALVAGWPDPG